MYIVYHTVGRPEFSSLVKKEETTTNTVYFDKS
jgi:hypothetical protein